MKNPGATDWKLLLFDLDGTLYLGDRLFDFTLPLLQKIRSTGRRYMFMTNNTSKSVASYVEKLGKLGIAAQKEDFITASQATIDYLKHHYSGLVLYVCGTESLKDELRENGFLVTQDPASAQCVLMGFDTELTFQKLQDVSLMLCTRDLPYLATHPDKVCPTEFGSVPDCGSVCDIIYNATGKRPIVIGKPEPLMPQLAMRQHGVDASQTLVIGDRLYTDIQCGINAGTATALVLSGETTTQLLAESGTKPTLVLENAGQLIDML